MTSLDDPTAFRPEDTPTVAAGDSAPRARQLTPGTILGGRYRIVSLIGKGGMGEVYRADDLKLGQTVALKFISRHGPAERLYEEVRIGRQVSHPNVCRLHDIADVEGELFITMEFVDGEDLASLLRRIGRLPSEKAVLVTRDICAGLAAAHDKGVIHRDLKPANVMIDGRGRARVTDFGLAIAGGTASDTAGTPAYMAPEQLAGEAASMRSDIYALGLVLYEIFTGRRTFEASSTHDLLARQQKGDFTRPSLVAREIPPPVERIIVRCLEADPEARPDSVEAILRDLPGGDPLSAAIAAGETPSPAMVAAASDRGELSAAAAWTFLAIGIAALIAYAPVSARTMVYRNVPLKSPESLRERALDILAATGQTLPRADSSAAFYTDTDHLQWAAHHGGLSSKMSPILFQYRQSPRPMVATGYEHRVLPNDPPLIYSGMADVALDSNGRLVQLTVVPPQVDVVQQPAVVDWKPFLHYAGVSAPLSPAQSQWSAPVDTDQKTAWTIGDGSRVEAASYHGRPVWFAVIPSWRKPMRMIERVDTGNRIALVAVVIINLGFGAAAIALALRNLRRGQSDRRGARRLALTVFGGFIAGLLLFAHHVAGAFDEFMLIVECTAFALLMGAETWIGYIAIEPLVRRRWPRMLIGTTRLLAGRVRDPMIGRDLLVGCAFGVCVVLLRQLAVLLPGVPLIQSSSLTLSGLRYVGWFVAGGIALAITGPIFAATLLVGLRVLTRSIRVSIIVMAILGCLFMVGDAAGPLWARVLFGLVAAITVLILMFRFGLLAYGAALFAYVFLRRMPITLDPSSWYFGRSTIAIVILIGIALYGFLISLGGKRWLPEIVVES